MKYNPHDKVWAVCYCDDNNEGQVYQDDVPEDFEAENLFIAELEVRALSEREYQLHDNATDDTIYLPLMCEACLCDSKEEAEEDLATARRRAYDVMETRKKCREQAEIYHIIVDSVKHGIKNGKGAALTTSIVLTALHRNGYEITKKEN